MDTINCGCTRHRDSSGNVTLRSFVIPNSVHVRQRLAAIQLEADTILFHVEEGDTTLDVSPYVHACRTIRFTPRLPWSSGHITLLRRPIRLRACGRKDRAVRTRTRHWRTPWLEAARAICCVPNASARYLLKRYPQEVAMILRSLYPGNPDTYRLKEAGE